MRKALALVSFALLPWIANAAPGVDPALAPRLAALDCTALRASDVAEVLALAPAPRIVGLNGSVPIVTMEPFAEYLITMGYPRERLAHPTDGTLAYTSFVDSRRLAGELAWHYEREGLMPMLIGHSQGGMIVIKVLHDLAGTGGRAAIPVWDPRASEPEPRTTIVDPHTGATLPVIGLKVEYAAALATGSLPRLLLGQWGILPLLRDVPDSAAHFTGFMIPWDPIAGTGPEPPSFHATGTASVRNVVLPAGYSHIRLPAVAHLAKEPATRAWIDAYRPGTETPPPRDVDTTNLMHAADIWYSVKRHWCEGAKRLAARAAARSR